MTVYTLTREVALRLGYAMLSDDDTPPKTLHEVMAGSKRGATDEDD